MHSGASCPYLWPLVEEKDEGEYRFKDVHLGLVTHYTITPSSLWEDVGGLQESRRLSELFHSFH